jgi:hypothetical protein
VETEAAPAAAPAAVAPPEIESKLQELELETARVVDRFTEIFGPPIRTVISAL